MSRTSARRLGISFETLYRNAYPNETGAVPTISAEDCSMRSRPATLKDAKLVLADLEGEETRSVWAATESHLQLRM